MSWYRRNTTVKFKLPKKTRRCGKHGPATRPPIEKPPTAVLIRGGPYSPTDFEVCLCNLLSCTAKTLRWIGLGWTGM